ncbi:MAG TPA: hypothetical protein EYP08_06105 [Pyrodictiaceae archaeon]|nr:hypothetical protein [Pyrodictiaceae archaeon]HIQ10886.1 hypothetical protein [Pyrodictium sp.]HIQ55253.1 hypothetical protein [Pyrodictium sp.]
MTVVEMACPRCRTKLEYRIEIELGNGDMRRIIYYYRCPRCLYRLTDATVVVRKNNGSKRLVIELIEALRSRRLARE